MLNAHPPQSLHSEQQFCLYLKVNQSNTLSFSFLGNRPLLAVQTSGHKREKEKYRTIASRLENVISSTPPPTSYCSLFLCLSHHPTPTTKKNQQRLLVRSSEMTSTCMYLCLHFCISLVLASQILSKTDVFLCAPPRLSLFLEYIILVISHKHDPPSFFSSPASSLSVLMK